MPRYGLACLRPSRSVCTLHVCLVVRYIPTGPPMVPSAPPEEQEAAWLQSDDSSGCGGPQEATAWGF